jgi:DNA topoisomerase-1
MAKSLIIVESPTKAKTITKYLGRGYTVMASVGHIKDLPTSKLGVDLDHNFKPQYVTIKGKSKVLAEIKKKAEGADKIFLAPDPDREGEAIAWHLAEELRGKSKKSDGRVFRVLFNEITERAIKQALQSPGQIDMKLVNAQQDRRLSRQSVALEQSPSWPFDGTSTIRGRPAHVRARGGAGGVQSRRVLVHYRLACRRKPSAV